MIQAVCDRSHGLGTRRPEKPLALFPEPQAGILGELCNQVSGLSLAISCPYLKNTKYAFPSRERSHKDLLDVLLLSGQTVPVASLSREKSLRFIQQDSRLKDPHAQLQVPQTPWTLQRRMWYFFWQTLLVSRERKELVRAERWVKGQPG